MSYRVNVTEEVFENVTVFDQPMLFTCEGCDKSTLPRGMYMYEIRHDDDMQGIPCEIAEWIFVNHWGTVISNKPIALTEQLSNGKKYRLINDKTDWNYEGTEQTLAEYMRKNPPQKERSYER